MKTLQVSPIAIGSSHIRCRKRCKYLHLQSLWFFSYLVSKSQSELFGVYTMIDLLLYSDFNLQQPVQNAASISISSRNWFFSYLGGLIHNLESQLQPIEKAVRNWFF